MALLDRLTLLIDADGRRATAELDRLGKKTRETLTIGQQFGRDFLQGLGVGAGAVSGLAAADALKRLATFSIEAARAAEDDARAQIVLAKALEISGGATQQQIQQTEAFISATSDSAGVVDDELRPALATLVRSTNDAVTAQRLLTLSLDISAGTGRDVGSVATALAKAWEGQTTALMRLLPEVGGLIREGASAEEVFARLQRTFGGTSEEAAAQAGSFARLNVSVGELKEEFGRGFLPTVESAARALKVLREEAERPLGEGFTQGLLGPLQSFGSLASSPLAGITGLIGGTGKSIKEMADNAKYGGNTLKLLEAGLDKAADSGAFFSDRLRDLGYGTQQFGVSLGITTSTVQGFEESLRSLAAAGKAHLSDLFGLSSAEDDFADALDNTAGSAGGAAKATRDLIAADFERERSARSVLEAELGLLDAEKELEQVRKGASDREKKRAALDVASAENRVQQAQRRIAEATNALNRATGRRGNADDAARARQELADALLEQEQANEDLLDTQERANETMRRGTEGSKDLADATKKVEDAQWSLREAIESQRQQAMQDQTDGGPVGRTARQQRDAFREAAQAANDIILKMFEAGAPTDVINTKIQEMVGKLEAAGVAAGMTRDEIGGAADELIAFGILLQAEQQRSLASLYGFGAYSLTEELEAMRRQGIYVPDTAFRWAKGRAGGGPVNAGQSYRVGENGPETLHIGNSPGWITPNGGSGTVVNFNGTVVADKATLERLVFEALQAAQRRGWN